MSELLKNNLHSSLIPTKVASEISGYNADYLARLCREKKVEGTQVGRSWLIDRASLENFVREQEVRKQVRADELRAARGKEYRRAQKPVLMDAFSIKARNMRQALQSFHLTPSTPTHSPRLAALAVALAVVAGSAYASTNPKILSALNVIPDAAVQMAFNAQPLLERSSSFRITDAATTSNVATLPRVPSTNDASRAVALIVPTAGMAALDSVHALTQDARVPVSKTDEAHIAQARIAFVSDVAHHPVQRFIEAYVLSGESIYDIGTRIGDTYLSGLRTSGDASLALAGTLRDGVVRVPQISNALLDGYTHAIYAWNDAAPKVAGTAVLAVYDTGDALGTHAVSAPSLARRTKDQVAQGAANAVLAVVPITVSAPAPARAPATPAVAVNTESSISGRLSGIYASATQAEGTLISLPMKAENTMLGMAGYAASVMDGSEAPQAAPATQLAVSDTAASAPALQASVISFLPTSWQQTLSNFWRGTNTFAQALIGSAVRTLAGLFPGGNVLSPTLTVLHVGPTETLALPVPAGSLTRPIGLAYGTASGGSQTVIRNVVNNYYPQALIGGVFSDAVLAVVRPFVRDSIDASVASTRGGGSGNGVSGNGGILTNVTIKSGTATLSSITADDSILGIATATTFTSGTTTLGTTTINGNLSVSGTINAGSLAVGSLSSNGAIVAPYFTATDTVATSTFTNLSAKSLVFGSSTFTSLLGTGLVNVAGTLGVSTSSFSGANSNFNADFLDGLDSTYFLANSFSTSSANIWLTSKSTDALAEGTLSLYFTDARARNALSVSGAGLAYSTTTGALSVASGFSIPLTASTTDWNTAYLSRISSATYPLQIVNNAISLAFGTSTSNTWGGTQTFTNAPVLGSLTGFLKATAGVLSTSLIDLSTDVSSTLSVSHGGTGSTSLTGLLKGNGTGALLTATDGTDYISPATYGASFYTYFHATTTNALAEGGSNLYYTNARARAAISSTAIGLSYDNTTGIFSLTGGYNIPLSASTTEWSSFYTTPSTRITAGTNLSWAGNTLNGVSDSYIHNLFSATSPIGYNSGTGAFSITQSNGSTNGYLSSTDWNTFNTKISSTSLSANYPLTYNSSSGAFNLAFGTTTANSWSALQQFNGNASTTQLTSTGSVYLATAGGKVGIGNASPVQTFDVTGTGRFTSTLTLGSITSCVGAQALQTDGSGNISCGAIAIGGASTGGGWTTNNVGVLTLATTTDRVAVGATTTPYAKLSVLSGNTATTTLALLASSGQTANILDIYDSTSALSSVFTASGKLGIGTTSPSQSLSVSGNAYITGSLTLGTLNGLVKGTNGALSAAVSGTDYAPATVGAAILYGNGAGGFSNASVSSPLTFSAGALGIQVANTSQNGYLSSGDWNTFNNKVSTTRAINTTYPLQGGGDLSADRTLTLAFGTTTSNTWAGTQTFTNTPVLGTLSGLVGSNNGSLYQIATSTNFVTSTVAGTGISLSGATGAVTITNTGLLSLAQTYGTAQTGVITFATTTVTANGQSLGVAITNSSGAFTFTPTISGTLNNAGLTNSTISGVALGSNLANLSATDSTLTFSGSYNGSTARTLGLNLGNANIWTALQQFNGNASSTGFSANYGAFGASGTTTISSTGALATPSLSIGSLTGVLHASSGVVSASNVNLASEVTGTLPVANGGTGSTTLTGLLKGNGTGGVQTALAGTDYAPATSGSALLYGNGSGGFLNAAVNSPLTFTGGALGIQVANTSQPGYLTSGDWNTFNGKENVLTFTYPLTRSTNTISLAFGTTTANSWSSLQTFNGGITVSGNTTLAAATTTTLFSTAYLTNTFAAGQTGTTTISSTGALTTPSLTVGSLSGILKASGGVVSTAVSGTDYAPATSGSSVLYGNGAGGFSNAAVNSPLTFSAGALGIQVANTSQPGYLTSGDWNTFNGKENVLTFTYPLTRSTNTISLAFGTTTSNTWAGTQTFTNTPVLGTLSGLVGSNNGALYQIATSTNFVTSAVAGTGIGVSGATGAVTITNNGLLSIAQTYGSAQTGAITVASSTAGTDFSITNSAGAFTFNLPTASASNRGLLSSADWTTFNSKQAALTFTYPLVNTTNTISLAFGTTTANSWSSLQTFNGGITVSGNTTLAAATTTTLFSTAHLTNTFSAGQTGTTTISSTGALTTPALTIGSLSGILKAASGVVSAAVSGTDYAPATSGSSVLYGNGAGGFSNAAVNSPLTFSAGALGIQVANTSQPGYLTSGDWNTFNGKQNLLTGTTGQTGYFSGTNTFTATSTLFLAASGNVGIGSTTPATTLSLAGNEYITGGLGLGLVNTTAGTLLITGSAGTTAYLGTSGASVNGIDLTIGLGGDFRSGAIDRSNNANGGAFQLFSNSNASFPGQVYFDAGNNASSAIIFRTGNTGTGFAATEKIRITLGGSLGIGTTTPWAQLSVNPNGIGAGPEFVVGSSSATHFIVTNAGNVGVGTTAPGDKLDVNGSLYLSAVSVSSAAPTQLHFNGSSQFNRIDLNGGFSGFQAGAGKRDTIADYWGLEIQGNRQATFPTSFTTGGGNDPSLTVVGGQSFAPVLELKGLASQSGDFFQITPNGGSTGGIFKVTSAGNVGIGTTTPSQALSVQGNGLFSGNIVAAGLTATGTVSFSTALGISSGGTNANAQTTNGVAYFDGTKITSGSVFSYTGTNVALSSGSFLTGAQFVGLAVDSTSAPSHSWATDLNTGLYHPATGAIGLVSAGTEYARLATGGNFGIGTTTPGSLLSVAGNSYTSGFINTSATTGGYKIDGALLGYASSTSGTAIFGIGAGGTTATTSAITTITAFGNQALTSYSSTGSTNGPTAFGYQALKSLTGGNFATAVGYQAAAATTNSSITAIGYMALSSFTTSGSDFGSIAVGANALKNTTTGFNNFAVGTNVLQANTTGANNLGIGQNAITTATTSSNTLAIGSGALQNMITSGTSVENTAVGYNSLNANTYGGNNTAFGYQTLKANTTGSFNTAISDQSLTANTTGSNNTALGYQSLVVATTSSNTTAIGYQALKAMITSAASVNNTAVGYQSLQADTYGGGNTGLGYQSLFANTTGNYNTAVGDNALANNSTGVENTVVGRVALTANTTGIDNTVLGFNAMNTATTSSNTVAIGVSALAQLTSSATSIQNTAIGFLSLGGAVNYGGNNTAVGYFSLRAVTTGSRNTGIGDTVLTAINTGSDNVGLGYQAGNNLTSGSSNIIIGSNIQAQSATASGQLSIGNTIFGTGVDATGTTVDTNALIGIGTSTPAAKLSVQTSTGGVIQLGTGSNYVTYQGQNTNQYGWYGNSGNYIQSWDIANGRTSLGAAGTAPLSTVDVLGNLAVGTYAGSTAAPTNGLIVSGNVGIGTTSPSTKLYVSSTGYPVGIDSTNSNRFKLGFFDASTARGYIGASATEAFAVGDNSGNTLVTVLSGGNVGIGATALATAHTYITGTGNQAQLYVVNSGTGANNYGADIEATGAGTTNYGLYVATANATNNYGLYMTSGFPPAGANNYALYIGSTAQSYFAGNVGIGTTGPLVPLQVGSHLLLKSDGANALFTTDAGTASIHLEANAYVSSDSNGLTVLGSNNNVGIGTSTPAETLTVNGAIQWGNAIPSGGSANTYNSGRLGTYTSGASPLAQYNFIQPATGKALVVWNAASNIVAAFGQTGSDSNTNSYFGGNVGIATTTPTEFLTIQGSGSKRGGILIYDSTLAYSSLIQTNSFGLGLYAQSAGQPITFNTAAGEVLRMTAGGNVGVGTTSPWRTFSVTGTVGFDGLTSSATGNAVCITANKEITNSGAASCTPSSIRFKENVQTLPAGSAISEINKLRVVSFDYKQGFYSPEELPGSYGVIAEEVQNVDPKLVDYGYDGKPISVHFEKLTGLTLQAVQELSQRTDQLSIATTSLSTQIATLSTSFASLQASTTIPHALTATSVTADSIQIAQGVSAGTLTAQSANVDGTVSAARYVVPQVASVFSFGSTTISMVVPAEALTTGGVDIYKLAGYASAGVDALAARTDLLAVKIDDLATRVAALEMMHAATTTSSTTDATAGSNTVGGAAGLALTTIQDALKSIGIIIHQGYLALDSLVTHQLFLVKGSDGTSSTGSVVIPVGATNLTVTNPLVHSSSKIFLTFTSSVNGSWYISKKLDGSFTITLSQAQSTDTEFDYFLIQTDPNAQVAAVGAAPPAGSTEAPPAPAPVSVDGGPVVTLNGDVAVQIPQGASWTDPGAHATAADGTDVTSSITVTGTVDANTAGLYTITYHATDAAGKVGQASRVVTVLSPTTAPSSGSTVTQAPPAATPPAAPADSGSPAPAGGTVSAAPEASPAS